jgi:hypothetical protein
VSCITVPELLKAIDRCKRPATAPEVAKLTGQSERVASKNVASMLSYLYVRGVLVRERVERKGKPFAYSAPEGKKAHQAHAEWLVESAKGHNVKQRRDGRDKTRKTDSYPQPAFALGAVWRGRFGEGDRV